MTRDRSMVSATDTIDFWLLLVNAVILKNGFIIYERWYWLLVITIPLQLFAFISFRKKVLKRGKTRLKLFTLPFSLTLRKYEQYLKKEAVSK